MKKRTFMKGTLTAGGLLMGADYMMRMGRHLNPQPALADGWLLRR